MFLHMLTCTGALDSPIYNGSSSVGAANLVASSQEVNDMKEIFKTLSTLKLAFCIINTQKVNPRQRVNTKDCTLTT